jgi:hypothetical protein
MVRNRHMQPVCPTGPITPPNSSCTGVRAPRTCPALHAPRPTTDDRGVDPRTSAVHAPSVCSSYSGPGGVVRWIRTSICSATVASVWDAIFQEVAGTGNSNI